MKRRNLLKQIGTMGIAAAIPVSKAKAADNPRVYPNGDSAFASGCWLTPSETEGPYYFNANLVLVLTEPGGAQSEVVRDAFLSVGSAPGQSE